MAETVISVVVENIGNFLIDEVRLIHGVRDQVRDLRDKLWWMQCFLRDADASQYEDYRIGTWVREIKEIVYAVGDVLESYVIRAESRRRGGILNVLKKFTCFVNQGIALHEFGSKIAATEARISKLTARLQSYGIRSLIEDRDSLNSVNQRQIMFRQTYSNLGKDDFVGLNDDVESLVENLVSHDCKVVAICGLGGLGKNSCKKNIPSSQSQDSLPRSCMDLYIQKWQPTNVLQAILVKLTPGGANNIYKEHNISS